MTPLSTFLSLRSSFLSRKFYMALEALEFIEDFHTSSSANPNTQLLTSFQTVTNLSHRDLFMIHPEETLTTGLVHKLPASHGYSFEGLARRFSDPVAAASRALTMEFKGFSYGRSSKLTEAASNPISSLVLASDSLCTLRAIEELPDRTDSAQIIKQMEFEIYPALSFANTVNPKQTASINYLLAEMRNSAMSSLYQSHATAAQ